ncbi:MAG: hypothetical protein A2427_01040 [Candidatus Nealsonbacteria bacterium RIFOXYC1_FULL_40_7]|uniref:Uncharacterized protein n=1 Tax=Candidatus Nealsonbacteria bacterium RIFOXYC1_FULL_40_7 TaxID=1801678 RepID=A0A1G2EMM0_9BACT|nr:MAG: hypothetical protein A2427_01040 [Candidatus Nealsonbacteria bacterium RIFOXYC1_FULL_40_7]
MDRSATASHIPLLVRLFDLSEGDVLEIGTGYFSTLLLHWLAHIYKRNVYSYENDPYWYKRALKANSKYHRVIMVNNWDDLPVDRHWGLVFVDHKPGERRSMEVKRFAKNADYILIHDTEPENEKEYHFSEIWPLFKYVYHQKKTLPWTSAVSNFKNLKDIK